MFFILLSVASLLYFSYSYTTGDACLNYTIVKKDRLALLRACSDRAKVSHIAKIIKNSPSEDLLVVDHLKRNVAHRGASVNFSEALEAIWHRRSSLLFAREVHFGNMPLHLAAWFGHNEAVKTILKYQQNINVRNRNRETPLMLAAMRGQVAVARVLLEHGASLRLKNEKGDTPLHLAIQEYQDGHQENRHYMVALLLNYGARKNALNKNKNTAAAIAREKGYLELAQFIENFEMQRMLSN